jgi:hypothetical protein
VCRGQTVIASSDWSLSLQVCLSISSHHPEHWQPSWSLRTALVALIAFMQTPGNGAIGSLVSMPSEHQIRDSAQHQSLACPHLMLLSTAAVVCCLQQCEALSLWGSPSAGLLQGGAKGSGSEVTITAAILWQCGAAGSHQCSTSAHAGA